MFTFDQFISFIKSSGLKFKDKNWYTLSGEDKDGDAVYEYWYQFVITNGTKVYEKNILAYYTSDNKKLNGIFTDNNSEKKARFINDNLLELIQVIISWK